MTTERPTIVGHRDLTFADQTLLLTGHAYVRCEMHACTLVYRGEPTSLVECRISNCVFVLDFAVHDSESWDQFMSVMANVITRNLPQP